jgi:uncharacterized membrane protein
MSLGPIELVVIGFPDTPTGGRIASEIQRLIDSEVITLVDGLFVSKEEDGTTNFVEIQQMDVDDSINRLSQFIDDSKGLLADEDVEQIADELSPGASALMLVFENTWVKGVRDAVADAGGVLMAQIRVPGPIVDEVMAAVAAE